MINSTFKELLQQHAGTFEKVVPFGKEDKLLRMDFTEANTELTADVLSNTASFSNYIYSKLQSSNSRYGIGGYDEHRTIYERSALFDASHKTSFTSEPAPEATSEPRRLHLGIDIWGKAFTPVMAPLDGIVHSFAFNNAFGDYGATIILTHRLEEVPFYTLYGHLSLNSIKNLHEGLRIQKGYVFAEFGIPQENGSWPPHLHFQIIIDLQGRKGDYPGVCKYSERDTYLTNCPDPDLILGMMPAA